MRSRALVILVRQVNRENYYDEYAGNIDANCSVDNDCWRVSDVLLVEKKSK